MEKILSDIKTELGFETESFSSVNGGFMNSLYKLKTDKGELLLKVYSRKRFTTSKLLAVEDSLQLQLILEKRGVPTARIYPIKGKAVRILGDGTAYCLMDYICGKNETCDTVNLFQIKSLGAALSRIHKELSLLGRAGKIEELRIEKLWENYEKRVNSLTDDMPHGYTSSVKAQKTILERIDQNRIDSIRTQLCHEDFTADNVIFGKDEVAAVIDFDRIRMSRPAHDIGRALLQFALTSGELKTDRIDAFMEGYGQNLPITDSDIKDAFLITWCIETLWWIDPEYFMGRNGKADRFCEETVFLTEHPEVFL